MSFKIRIELFKELEITSLDFESNAATQILSRFDQIDWMQQVVWGYMVHLFIIFGLFYFTALVGHKLRY